MAQDDSESPVVPVDVARAGTRALVSAAAGLVAFAVAMALVAWQVAVLVGWDATAATMLGWIIVVTHPRDHRGTRALAEREDDSRAAADFFILSACSVSLVAVGFVLVKAGQTHGTAKALITTLAVVSVFLAWAAVHAIFTLRYARLYYTEGGGIDFNSDEEPDYRDFAYVALTLGMTYQVSDTDLGTKVVRQTATRHGLLSYLYGTVVVAVMINVVASLLR
jgi:uncharacterized membrane protein